MKHSSLNKSTRKNKDLPYPGIQRPFISPAFSQDAWRPDIRLASPVFAQCEGSALSGKHAFTTAQQHPKAPERKKSSTKAHSGHRAEEKRRDANTCHLAQPHGQIE
jgi:hypothetical protein